MVLPVFYVHRNTAAVKWYRYVHLPLPANLSANITREVRKPQDNVRSNKVIQNTELLEIPSTRE